MTDEQIHFVQEAAKRIAEKADEDLKPLAGRMDKLLFNGTLRQLLSARDPTASIQEIVDSGRAAVLRLDPALGEASERLTCYLDRVDVSAETPSQIEGVVGRLPETLLERDCGDELRVRCTDEGKM